MTRQERMAELCATLITFALERDTGRVDSFLDKYGDCPFSEVWDQLKDVDGYKEPLTAIRAIHRPRFGSEGFTHAGANYTWGLATQHLARFVQQVPGDFWKLQRPENSAAFLRGVREQLGNHFNAKRMTA